MSSSNYPLYNNPRLAAKRDAVVPSSYVQKKKTPSLPVVVRGIQLYDDSNGNVPF